ncbi:MAG TPA: hypothetical protein VLT45_07805 [Kofleriaceae bacterium]|nr:hypothetical protein [Kofleriaceae bacterium]
MRQIKDKTIQIRLRRSELRMWKAAAEAEGVTLSELIRRICAAAAREQ